MKENVIDKSARNYGIDLLRIVSMLMVVVLHVLGHGGVLKGTDPLSANYLLSWFINISAYCAVNCYGLISGFVGIKSKSKYANICYLWVTVVFYSLLSFIVFAVCMPEAVGIKGFISTFFPVTFNAYWYFSSYFCLFFFIPFLNKLMYAINKKQATVLVLSICFLFSIVSMISMQFGRDPFDIKAGYNAIWLASLYIIGAYIRLYDIGKNIKKRMCFLLYLLQVIITFCSRIVAEIITAKVFGVARGENLLISYISPTILLSAVFLRLLFSRINVKNCFIKIISFFSPLAFSVYIIHTQYFIETYLIEGRFQWIAHLNPFLMAVVALAVAMGIWFVCSMIDVIRYYLFKWVHLKEVFISLEYKVSDYIKNKIN